MSLPSSASLSLIKCVVIVISDSKYYVQINKANENCCMAYDDLSIFSLLQALFHYTCLMQYK